MKALRIFSLAAVCLSLSVAVSAQTKTETFKVSGNCGMCKTKIEKAAKDAGAKEATWNEETKMLTVTYKSATTNTAKIQQKIADVGYDNAGFKATLESYKKLHACCQYDRGDNTGAPATEKKSCCSDKCEMKDGKCADMAACKEKGCCKDEETCKANGCCGGKDAHQGMHGKMECCKDGKCEMKDGKCADMAACKEKGCCKDEETCKANGCCSGKDAHMAMNGKMDCCKDGKCTKPGHDGKDCCKKDGEKMDCCKDGKCTKPGHDGKDCCKKAE